ncbi:MAG TPA: hypothetical protein VHJ18_26465 [Streptosporangiaceae bacterium]|nr:hypothetical protein [Streptosporangiaceae bacterium]
MTGQEAYAILACARQSGHRRRMNVLDPVRSRRQKIIASGLMTERELDELDVTARAHIEDPATVLAPMLYALFGLKARLEDRLQIPDETVSRCRWWG